MTIQTFLEKARDGRYNPGRDVVTAEVLLDPLAWKAVGKVEGWDYRNFPYCQNCEEYPSKSFDCPMKHCHCAKSDWEAHMHRMIDALAEGKTIEQFLETL